MLIGISPLVGPELLAALCRMGHGDELVLADAHFPAETLNARVIRADGLKIADLLDGILPLLAIDDFVDDPIVMMEAVAGDASAPAVARRYRAVIEKHHPAVPPTKFIPRFEFYERARGAWGVVITGETAKYGNIILKKGVTPV